MHHLVICKTSQGDFTIVLKQLQKLLNINVHTYISRHARKKTKCGKIKVTVDFFLRVPVFYSDINENHHGNAVLDDPWHNSKKGYRGLWLERVENRQAG